MDQFSYEINNKANVIGGFVVGLLLGGLVGATTMLLVAPQTGRKTRAQIEEKGILLRDQTAEVVEATISQAGDKIRQIGTAVNNQAKELEQQGKELLDEQKKRWSPVIEAGITAVENSKA